MGGAFLIQDENQTEMVEHLLAFDLPKGPWRIQRRDGWFYKGYESAAVGDVFVAEADRACPFHTERSAQNILDLNQNSLAGRKRFRGCRPVFVGVEPGDHVICPSCGLLHERDYCAATDGQGAAQ